MHTLTRRCRQWLCVLATLALPLALSACDDEPIEEAGEEMQDAVEEVGDELGG